MPNTIQELKSDNIALNVKNPAEVVMVDFVNCITLIHFYAEGGGGDWKDHVTSDIRNAANG